MGFLLQLNYNTVEGKEMRSVVSYTEGKEGKEQGVRGGHGEGEETNDE